MNKSTTIDDSELSFRPQRSPEQRKALMEVNWQTRYNHIVQKWDKPEFEIPSYEAWCYAQGLDDIEQTSFNDALQDQDIFTIIETLIIHMDSAKLTMTNQGNCALSGFYYQQIFKMEDKYAKRITDLLNHYSSFQPVA